MPATGAPLPRSPSLLTRGSLALLQLRDREAGRGILSLEFHLVADLDLLEHRGIADAIDHGHALVHAEALGRAMLEGDLAGALVDLLDFAVDGLRRHRGRRQGRGKQCRCRHAYRFLHHLLLSGWGGLTRGASCRAGAASGASTS